MLLWDMEIQYIDIYNWYHDVLHGRASLFYDFSKSLGGNMYGVFATYLVSPLNLLVFFFPKDLMPNYIALATLTKIGLSGLFCQVYLTKRFRSVPLRMDFLLSLSYALMEYNVGLCSNLHFLDAIYLLPLIALGVYRCVRSRGFMLLSVSIGLTLLFNWYVGYMACLGAAVISAVELFAVLSSGRDRVRAALRLSACFFAGALIGCATFIPAVFAAMGGKGQISVGYLLDFRFHCDFLEPLKGLFFTAMANSAGSETEPAIYVGGFPIALLLTLFCSGRVQMRAKVIVFLSLLFVYVSFSFVPLEVVWSTLRKTYSFFYRHSFVFSFMIILGATYLCSVRERADAAEYRSPLLVCAMIVAYCTYVCLRGYVAIESAIMCGCVALFFVVVVSLLLNDVRGKTIVWAVSALAVAVELGVNAYYLFGRYLISIEQYSRYTQTVEDQIEAIDASDNSFYRLEKTFSEMDVRRGPARPVATEGLTFNYNAITHYSSLIDSRVDAFLERFGYLKGGTNASNYVDTNPVGDSLLGVKYLLTDDRLPLLREAGAFELPSGELERIYVNDYAMGSAIEVKGSKKVKWKSDPFANQEAVVKSLTGEDPGLFRQQTIDEEAAGVWNIHIDDEGPAYAFFAANHEERKLLVNGEYVENYFNRFYHNVVYLGDYKQGDVVRIELEGDQDCEADHHLLVRSLDVKNYIAVFEGLVDRSYYPTTAMDTHLEYDIVADSVDDGSSETRFLFTVPHDDGWSVFVDGTQVNPQKIYDTFISVKVSEGRHSVVFSYSPPALYEGLLLSVLGLAAALLLDIMRKRRGERK